MRRTIGIIALAVAFAATGAAAENAVWKKRAELAQLWGKDTPAATGPVASSARTNITGIGVERRDHLSGHWADNWRGGRKHPPTGR